MQRANARNAAICAGVCAAAWLGAPLSGRRCWQAAAADWNAGECLSGEFGLSENLNSRGAVVGSGKSDTPRERMQSAKLTASSCSRWICAGLGWLLELDAAEERSELEPQPAASTETTPAATRRG